mgnify:CR=1 FL=1
MTCHRVNKLLRLLSPHRWMRGPSRCTREQALTIADHFGLVAEVRMALDRGYSPDDALLDWDIYPHTDEQLRAWTTK